jgi:hypothetical protein
MSNTHLADVHEITFAIYCALEDPKHIKYSPSKVCTGNFLVYTGSNKDITDLVDFLHKSMIKIKPAEKSKALTKFIQARNSVNDLKDYLKKPGQKCPAVWGDPAFWNSELTIVDSGWTNNAVKFVSIVKNFLKQCPKTSLTSTVSHDNNPSDVVILVEDTTGLRKPLGISLKATFTTSDIGIYNGGMCAFLAIISGKEDLANKKSFCPSTKYKGKETTVKLPYANFLKECSKTPLKFTGSIKGDKLKWKSIVGTQKQILNNNLWNDKLMALSMVRDNLYDNLATDWNLDSNGEADIDEAELNKIVGGIFQFTHSSIKAGGCNVPYFKLTSLLNLKLTANTIESKINSNTLTTIAPPDLSNYVKSGSNKLKITKLSDVSILFSTNGNAHFTIRVKLESVPPSSIKIDICPYNNKKSGGSSSARPTSSATTRTLLNPGGTLVSSVSGMDSLSNLDKYNIIKSKLQPLTDEEYSILNNIWDETMCEREEEPGGEDDDINSLCETIVNTTDQIKVELITSIKQEIQCLAANTDLLKRLSGTGPQTRALTSLREKVSDLTSLLAKLSGVRFAGKKRTRRRRGSRRKGKGSRRRGN